MIPWRENCGAKTRRHSKKVFRPLLLTYLSDSFLRTNTHLTSSSEFENYVRVPIHGTECKVSVFMELPNSKDVPSTPNPNEKKIASRRPSAITKSDSSNTAKVFIATVDLARLGKWVKKQRSKKQMQHIYVIGRNPVGFGPVVEEECCDLE